MSNSLSIKVFKIFYAFDIAIKRIKEISLMFKSILDIKDAKRWSVIFCIFCMPLVAALSYLTMKLFTFPLPTETIILHKEIPLMVILYFLGAIPEEFGWTYTLTEPLFKSYGSIKSGIIIGITWASWHIVPWGWAHPSWWIFGMCVLNILMRIAMVDAYISCIPRLCNESGCKP